jgi:aryl carrier-like protein
MNKLLGYFSKPIVPLLIINSGLNQERTVNLLEKLRKVNYSKARAIGLVVEIDNHMPVQIDKIAEFLNTIKEEYHLNLYGFCHSHVSAESYYLLSNADRLYTMPSTIFQLSKGTRTHSAESLMKTLGITKVTTKSQENLIGAGLDSFTSANTSKYLNQKLTEINQRLHEFSVLNRQAKNDSFALDPTPPSTMLGI